MSAETQPTAELAAVLTFRKLLLVGLILIPASLIGIRLFELSSVQNVGEPFDVEAFTSYIVPDAKNAFLHFKKAGELLVSSSKVLERSGSVDPQTFVESETAGAEGWEQAIWQSEVGTGQSVHLFPNSERERCADCLVIPLSKVAASGRRSIGGRRENVRWRSWKERD